MRIGHDVRFVAGRLPDDRDTADARFKAMLRDFIATHRNGPVTTEDFKAAVEKHMVPEMNLDGNGTMDWFFRQYVYGTALPTYKLEQSVASKDGQTLLSLKITQSGVHDGFKMPVPLYVELTDGRVVRLGSATMVGNKTIEQQVPLGNIPVKRALLNYYYDVLGLEVGLHISGVDGFRLDAVSEMSRISRDPEALVRQLIGLAPAKAEIETAVALRAVDSGSGRCQATTPNTSSEKRTFRSCIWRWARATTSPRWISTRARRSGRLCSAIRSGPPATWTSRQTANRSSVWSRTSTTAPIAR